MLRINKKEVRYLLIQLSNINDVEDDWVEDMSLDEETVTMNENYFLEDPRLARASILCEDLRTINMIPKVEDPRDLEMSLFSSETCLVLAKRRTEHTEFELEELVEFTDLVYDD